MLPLRLNAANQGNGDFEKLYFHNVTDDHTEKKLVERVVSSEQRLH